MTGYASVQQRLAAPENDTKNHRLELEIRSVNSRHLDLALRLPEALRGHEAALRATLARRLKRGKVELRLEWRAPAAHGDAALPAAAHLRALAARQSAVQQHLPQARALTVYEALRLYETDNGSDSLPAADWATVLPALARQALDGLLDARAREGAHMAAMLRERCTALRQLAAQAAALAPQLAGQQRQRFIQRWHDALDASATQVPAEAAHERALLEAAAYALRIDVAEEISRLQAHLDAIEALLRDDSGAGEAIGKRLEFLIQELHREANTIGSKSATLETTRISVDMRVLIEQMREQVQNIE